jgi:DNA-3-methyladenine glycosylase II
VFHIQPALPYSFSISLKRLINMPRPDTARVEPGPVYVRALSVGDRRGVVRVAEAGEGLSVSISGNLAPEPVLAAVRRAFSLDLDLSGFYRHIEAADPVMAQLARRFYGARPIQSFDLWEALAWTIIGQQVNISFAFAMKESLVRLCGLTAEGYPAFPGPEAVAALQYEQLQAEKYTRKKAEYVIDLARAIASGRLELEPIAALPFEQAVAALVKLRGVGRWTAEVLLMDAGVPDALPAGDIGIRNAVQRFYGLDHQPSEAEVRELGRAWAPYSALASYYLWLGLLDKG